jgi:glutathione S-transferase
MLFSFYVIKARKQFKVKYPNLYAAPTDSADTDAFKFNCAQRAHQNCLENQPTFLAHMIVAGLRYPYSASIAGAIYLVGKYLYVVGYKTGDPKKRMNGTVAYLGTFGLVGMIIKFACELFF